ncbi:Glucose-methanol-choline oxidoreductase [Emericellopsis cladophorae]|uniref:Glucose-methanol-choline oxidoreductase n=1 Tax=Emericellopsis cladophorae TaxID=2686198 RepID=A0A9Q0BAK2_9HYPO|nr:Glucose-methanol-choline oxidoreductase [Emericellopsis cladophorae]KAI6777650.1 Glucose-methanol-choline oxidoreductase [Emericellopsis cladophorae]
MELDTDVLIIGAGMSGLGLAVQLVRSYGHRRFEIVEKAEHLGGTWWTNSYPGCGVDVVAHYYAYSFCMNPNWSRKYPLQPEILAYFERVAAKYDIEKHIRFQSKVESAHWEESSGTWLVDVRNLRTSETYQRRCKILVSAVGILSQPNDCDIRGHASFKGRLFHSTQWDHLFDWNSKSVVVIGNGCSGSQIVPAISEGDRAAAKVTQFARQAQWVFERPNPEYSKAFQFVMRWTPFAMRLYRFMHNYYAEMDFKSFPTLSGAAIREMYATYQGAYIRRVSPEKYHGFLVPKSEVGCKRRVMDSEYLESLGRDNVELVYDDPIEEIVEDGVRTNSGRLVEADAIVLANGFQVQKPLLTLNLHGRGGVSVAEHWENFSEGAASAYFGTCLSQFPNYFILMGPNTASGHGSVSYITECQINFTMRVIKPVLKALKAQRSRLPVLGSATDVVEVQQGAEKQDIDNVQERVKDLVWSSGCTSWALDETTRRNTTMYPDFQYRYWLRSVFVPWKDFEFSRSSVLEESLAGKSVGLGTWATLFAGVSLAAAVFSFGVPGLNATYDYIVIGGGNAGLTLATRLAEQQGGSVAVVEAGTFYETGNGNRSQVPFFDHYYISKAKDDYQPLVDWGYVTKAQKNAYDVELHYARGKCLGGSSARNYMIYQRANKNAYKRWAQAVGDDSYTFDNFLPFFNKGICFTPPNNELRFANSTPSYDASVMGNCSGPLSVTYSNYAHSFASWSVNGLKAMGLKMFPGFASGSLVSGQSYVMSAISAKDQIRDSSETSFMRKALDLPNYAAYVLTQAKKITFSRDKKANGVWVDTLGSRYHLTATKEVIVSAGTFASPQLLMVSGVGPADALKKLDILVVADRPGVGQGMQDHLYFGPSYRVKGLTTSSLLNPDRLAEATRDFNVNSTGMLTNPSNDIIAWEKFPKHLRSGFSKRTLKTLESYPADWPEIELLAISAFLGYQNTSAADPNDGRQYATMGAALCMPRSRGSVTIKSADNAVSPIIDPNYFADPADVEVAVAAYKRVREFWTKPAVKAFRPDDVEAFPGLHVKTDAQIEKVIKESFQTIFHASSTCAMGKQGDYMAVVDNKAKVFGVSGLRVVDASVFPFLPPGHPMSTVYALAEKIATDITGR